MQRRGFLAALAASCASPCLAPRIATGAIVPSGSARRAYARTLLVDGRGQPLRAANLARERNYVFHYPYATTPCFLLDLGRPAPAEGSWPGGIGPNRSLVAYSAICSHRLTYPTREISFISYRAESSPQNRYARVIHCCSEHSQYDPAQGARVLAGPAPHPLAAILLEHDSEQDSLHAIGTLGFEMFETFFEKFAFRLALENGAQNVRKPVGTTTRVVELDSYCRQQVRC